MKKRISSIFLLMLALLTSQKIVAASQDAGGTNVIFEETFATSLGKFTMEGEKGEKNDVWSWEEYTEKCAQYKALWKIMYASDAATYLVSPEVKIGAGAKLSFEHKILNVPENVNTKLAVCLRTIGGEWTELTDFVYPKNTTDPTEFTTGSIDIPADFTNKTIQFAFKGVAKNMYEKAEWYIKNLKLTEVSGGSEGGDTPVAGPIYSITFDSKENVKKWTTEGNNYFFFWKGTSSLHANGSEGENLVSCFVSPAIKLDAEGNEIEISHYGLYFNKNMSKEAQIVIREGKGNWTALDVNYDENNKTFYTTKAAIPASFNGKEVQIGLKYTSNYYGSSEWFIKELKVNKAAPEEKETIKAIFEENFMYGTWQQTFEGTENVWGNDDSGMGGIKANAQYLQGDYAKIEASFITKPFKLFKKNTLSFTQKLSFFKAMELVPSDYLSVSISAVKNGKPVKWNEIEGITFPEDFQELNTGEIAIPEDFDNLEVMLSFTYKAKNKSECGVWNIKDIKVSGLVPAPKLANISYDVNEVNYELGTGAIFETPVLNNPNKVKVHYEADWELVNIDNQSGKINEFTGKTGKAVIKAIADETIEFLADTASYTINITNPYVLFEGLDKFKEEVTKAWTAMPWMGGAQANYNKNNAEFCYYVSPEIALSTEGGVVSFSMQGEGVSDWATTLMLSIRTNKGEWEDLTIANYPGKDANAWDYVNTDEIAIPEKYYGKAIQFGLKYHNVEGAVINVKDFAISKKVERKEAGIAYDKAEIAYELGGKEEFVTPVIKNPNKLEITYTMNEVDRNKGVIELDEKTGEVKIKDVGEVTIIAKTARNYKFLEGEASYKLTVSDPYLILKAKFAGDSCNFTTEGVEGIWKAEWGNTTASSNPNFKEGEKAYFVSPEIQMRKSGNTVSWEQSGFGVEWEKQAHFAVREGKGEWVELTGITYPGEGVYSMTNTGNIEIPAQFNSKKVQVAFVFISNGKEEPGWNIQNLIVRSTKRLMVDPEIAFDKDTVTYEMSSNEKFVAPTLSNPNNVEVKYTSSNEKVATITEAGEIKFIGRGETTITATSVETEKFDVASASYVLVVINKVDPEIAFEKETVEYNLASDKLFVEPKLKNENKVAVKYSSSNVEIATVDEATGKVKFTQKEGKTTIKAASEETEEFLAAEASYELVVVKTVDGIESVLGVDLKNAKIYDLQGRKVNKLGKGMFIINGKKVVIK